MPSNTVKVSRRLLFCLALLACAPPASTSPLVRVEVFGRGGVCVLYRVRADGETRLHQQCGKLTWA